MIQISQQSWNAQRVPFNRSPSGGSPLTKQTAFKSLPVLLNGTLCAFQHWWLICFIRLMSFCAEVDLVLIRIRGERCEVGLTDTYKQLAMRQVVPIHCSS